jgi:hypothetical protein
MKALDSGYPKLKAPWGSTGDNILIYQATFAAGSLTASGINETCLLNGNSTSAHSLGYAQLTPVVNMTASDTLQVQWEVEMKGQ